MIQTTSTKNYIKIFIDGYCINIIIYDILFIHFIQNCHICI